MYDTQLIKNKKSFFTYHGESLDLMNPPDMSNQKLRTLYFKFINNTLAIYRNSKVDGVIPVFWTKISNENQLTRFADPNSTLKTLSNNESYYIILADDSKLPLEIPKPISFQNISCLSNESSICHQPQQDCESKITFTNYDFNSVELSDSYSSNISIPLSGLEPNKKYRYSMSGVLSNLSAKIYPTSGFIERNGPTNEKLETSANLEFIFSYTSPSDDHNINNSFDNTSTDKVFTFLQFKLWEDNYPNSILLSEDLRIVCNNCLSYVEDSESDTITIAAFTESQICPEISFDSSQKVVTDSTVTLPITYKNIDLSKNLSYQIVSKGSNWPIRISSNSGLFVPTDIYPISGTMYASGIMKLDFTFNNSDIEPYFGWSNLNYMADENYWLDLIKENIYANLEVQILNNNNCDPAVDNIIIFCDECLEDTAYDCIKNANVVIKNTDNTYYDLKQKRPGAEITIPIECCNNDQHIDVDISNICENREYTFEFVSTPEVNIIPKSGAFFAYGSSYNIQAVLNLQDTAVSNLECIVKDKQTQLSVSDSVIVRCNYCNWNEIKTLNEIYSSNNYTYGYFKNNLYVTNDGSTAFVAVPSGYLYRSTDYGINWEPLDQYGKRLWSGIDYAENTNTLYLTTGRSTSSTSINVSGEVYSSSNNGDNITAISSIGTGVYSKINVSDNGQYISLLSGPTGIALSSDSGASWDITFVTGIVTGSQQVARAVLKDISVSDDRNKIGLSSDKLFSNAAVSGFFVSTNSGSDWVLKYLPFYLDKSINIKYSKNGNMLCAYPNATTTKEIYLSYDDGESWRPRVFSLSAKTISDVLLVSDDGSSIIVSTNSAYVYKTIDSGENWTWEYTANNESYKSTELYSTPDNQYKISLNQKNNQYSINLYRCPLTS